MKFYDILLEVLTQQEYEPFGNLERDPKGLKLMDEIFDRIKGIVSKYHESRSGDRDSFPSYVSSKDGDRLYVPFETSEDDVKSRVRDVVAGELQRLGFLIVNYKKGLAKNEDSGQVVKIGKVLSKYSSNDSQFGSQYDSEGHPVSLGVILKQYTEDPARASSRSDKLMVVFSKHPYDIAGMSTDRDWGSCQRIGGAMGSYLFCGVREGTIVIYLISGDDPNVEHPIGRTLAKQYVNKDDPNDIMYVVSGEYGNAPSDFKVFVTSIFDKINKRKVGTYKYNSGLYNDEKDRIHKYDVDSLIEHPEELKKLDTSEIGEYDMMMILLGNRDSILYLGDYFLNKDMIHFLIRKNPNFFNEDVNGWPFIDWVSISSRAQYYNILLKKPDYFLYVRNFGYDDYAMAYLKNHLPVFINRKGELDVSGVEIDPEGSVPEIEYAAYYNTITKDPKYVNFGRFGQFGGDIALVKTIGDGENSPRVGTFINREFKPDLTGVDINKISNDFDRAEYFNQKFNTRKFSSARKTNNPNVYLMRIDNESFTRTGRLFDYDAYFMNVNGKPDLTGIDEYNSPVGALKLTAQMINDKRINEIKVGFKRFI